MGGTPRTRWRMGGLMASGDHSRSYVYPSGPSSAPFTLVTAKYAAQGLVRLLATPWCAKGTCDCAQPRMHAWVTDLALSEKSRADLLIAGGRHMRIATFKHIFSCTRGARPVSNASFQPVDWQRGRRRQGTWSLMFSYRMSYATVKSRT